MKRLRFDGKVAIVTGGSMGIGRSTVLQLVTEGAHVVSCARRKAKLDELETATKGLKGSFTGYVLDVGDTDAFAALINARESCANASEYLSAHGGKPWRYLLIPHDEVVENRAMPDF